MNTTSSYSSSLSRSSGGWRLLLAGLCLLRPLAALADGAATPAEPPLREYREYPGSSDPSLKLFAQFRCATPTGILLVKMHGWHGAVRVAHTDNIANPIERGYFIIEPEMRGRGQASGTPDCNGWELQDVIDAVEFARVHYRDRIASPAGVLLWGGSGGGGNAYGLVGKFPDYFSAAIMESGMSDYGLWHSFDRKGEFRDELEGVDGKDPKGRPAWIGGSPETNAEAYRSRGGLTTVGNLLTPSLIFHGSTDVRVPAMHARLWAGAALGQGRGGLVTYHEMAGVGDHRLHNANETKAHQTSRVRTSEAFLRAHQEPPALPPSGSLVVAGYVKTARFEVILDSIDRVGRVDYDLAAGTFTVRAPTATQATLRVLRDGRWHASQIDCAPDPASPPATSPLPQSQPPGSRRS